MSSTPTPPTPTQPYKAIAGFILTVLAQIIATVQGRTDLTTMTVLDWVIVFGSALVVAGAVYGVTNPAKV